jgi:hypothetical protein
MQIGDRVKIIGTHPHAGEEGNILQSAATANLRDADWVVSSKDKPIYFTVKNEDIERLK